LVRRRGSTIVPNATVYDTRLSYSALGLLLVLLARPDQAPHGYRDLTGRGLGEKAVRNALRELDGAGYRHQLKMRSPNGEGRGGTGRVLTLTVVSEDPIDEDTARKWLVENADRWMNRAADAAARYDQGKHAKAAGRTVRRLPQPGVPQPGRERHLSYESQGEKSLRSSHPEDQRSEPHPQASGSPPAQRTADPPGRCEHGAPLGLNAAGVPRCPKCRHRARLAMGLTRD
jgi:hypothetical protein